MSNFISSWNPSSSHQIFTVGFLLAIAPGWAIYNNQVLKPVKGIIHTTTVYELSLKRYKLLDTLLCATRFFILTATWHQLLKFLQLLEAAWWLVIRFDD